MNVTLVIFALLMMFSLILCLNIPGQDPVQDSKRFGHHQEGKGKPLTGANQMTTLPKPGSTMEGSALGSYNGGNGGYGGTDGSMVQPSDPPPQEYAEGYSMPCKLCGLPING